MVENRKWADKKRPKKILRYKMSEIIDFTIVKLNQLHKEYKAKGDYPVADAIMHVIDEYQSGNAEVVWKEGLPYVKYLDEL